MDNSANYLNNIQSSVASNQNVLNMKQKAEDYKKAGLDWWKEPAEILGSQMAEGSLRHMGGTVLKKVGAKTGSQALTNLGSDIQSGKDIRKSMTSASKAIGQEATETAQSKLEQAGELMRSRLTNKVPLSLDEQRAAIRAKVLNTKQGRKLMREKKKIDEPKRQLNKRESIEQKSRLGRASNLDESISKPMLNDPFTGKEILPKPKVKEAPAEPVIDPDTGKEIRPAEDIIAEQQSKYDPENPLEKQILDKTKADLREKSTIEEPKKSVLQSIQDLQEKISPVKKPEEPVAKGTPEDPIQLSPFEIEPSFDPTAKLEGEFTGEGGSFTGAGGQKITAGEYQPTKEQLKTLEQSDKATKPEEFPKQIQIPKENLPQEETELDKKQARYEKLKNDYSSLSNDSKKSYRQAITDAQNKGLDKGDLETREALMSQVKSQDTPDQETGAAAPPEVEPTDSTQTFQTEAASTDQSNKEIIKTDEDSEKPATDEDPIKDEPVEDAELGLSDLADPLIGAAGLGLALAPLFEGKPSAPSPPPQSALLNPASQMGDT